MRVLVIEDDEELAEIVGATLRRAQMAVDIAYDGGAGLERALENDYDVIVLDRDLPGVHGDQICAQLMAQGCRGRMLMLTAAATTDDLVDGLALGADDYVAKPFDLPELVARVGALARRSQPATPPILRHGDLELDTARRRAWRGGRLLELSPKELGVLERVWDENADPLSQAVKTTVSRLRAKLGDPPLIETVVRAGYRI